MKKWIVVLVLLGGLGGAGWYLWKQGTLKKWGIYLPGEERPAPVVQKPATKPAAKPPAVVKVAPDGSPTTQPLVVTPPPVSPTPTTVRPTPPPGPTVADKVKQAELALSAAKSSLEKIKTDSVLRMTSRPEFVSAKASVDKTETAVKALRLKAEPGSAELAAASRAWIESKNVLAKLARQSLDTDTSLAVANQAIKDRSADLERLRSQLAGEERQQLAALQAAKAAYAPPAPNSIGSSGNGGSTPLPAPAMNRNGSSGRTGEGFAYQKLGLRGGLFTDDVVGEITNATGRDFTVALFNIVLTDSAGRVLETVPASVENFKNGQSSRLEASINVDASKVAGFKVVLRSGV